MSTIAVAADRQFLELDEGWPLLRQALLDRSALPSIIPWDEPSVDWSSFDLVLVAYVWGYVTRRDTFLGWARDIRQTTVVNSVPVLEWNSHKGYLRDLAARDIPVVPTRFLEPGELWFPPPGEWVVKPAVGSGGHRMALYGPTESGAAVAHVQRLHDDRQTVLIQPYLETVESGGEVSLVFLDGRFSHAVTKGAILRPGAGEVERLWERQTALATEVRPDHLEVATAALDAARRWFGPLAYGRVDLIEDRHGDPLVSELELVEPALFLRQRPESAHELAEALLRWAGETSSR